MSILNVYVKMTLRKTIINTVHVIWQQTQILRPILYSYIQLSGLNQQSLRIKTESFKLDSELRVIWIRKRQNVHEIFGVNVWLSKNS